MESSPMRTMNWIKNGLLALASVGMAQAGFHLTLDIGSLKDATEQDLSSGTVIVMVSTADDTFTPPEAGGAFAVVGDDEYVGSAAINDDDENILKIFASDYGVNWAEGDPIGVYFVPAAIGPNDALAAGQAFGFYSKADDDGEGDPWTLPEDGTLLVNLKMLTADVDEIASAGSLPPVVGATNFQVGTAIAATVQPTNVSASSENPGSVTINWDGAVDGGAFSVERKRVGKTEWELLGFADGDVTTFEDMAVSGGESYDYRILAVNGFGSEVSAASLVDLDIWARLANISTRGIIGSGSNTMVMGFVVRGQGDLPLLARAAGPALSDFFSHAAQDPSLTLISDGNEVGANDDWSSEDSDLKIAAFTAVGAFDFADGSQDAAILSTVDSSADFGVHTFATSNLTGEDGIGLVEVYDIPDTGRIRFTNLSSRAFVGTGSDIIIGGFVVKGPGAIKLLIRGIGPYLNQFFSGAELADPVLTLLDSNENVVASNDDWTADLQTAFDSTGAFAIPNGSKDAAMVVELSQGVYSVHLSGKSAGTGIALLEFYEIFQ